MARLLECHEVDYSTSESLIKVEAMTTILSHFLENTRGNLRLNSPEEAEKLKERVSAEFNCAELWLTEFSPVMGYACGTGTVGLAFYAED